jgi:putative acetyltransferase
VDIRVDNLQGDDVKALLLVHAQEMERVTPQGSCHYLDLSRLQHASVTFWTIWEGDELAGCGALKELSAVHGEVKSMRTASAFRRRGVAARLLHHIIDEARRRGYQRLSLETGRVAYFEPARNLYASFGFENCAPFGDYQEDPNSVFMTKDLRAEVTG